MRRSSAVVESFVTEPVVAESAIAETSPMLPLLTQPSRKLSPPRPRSPTRSTRPQFVLDHRLTQPNVDQARRFGRTYAGQAHWIDPPIGATCRDCISWEGTGSKPGRGKFKQLTNQFGAPVPGDACACRFYEPTPIAPAKETGG
jgi:hypothetical protein